MNEITPASLIICIPFIFVGAAMIALGGPAEGWRTAGWLCFGIGTTGALWIPGVALINARAYLIKAQADFITAYNGADPQTRDALGLRYPRLRVRLAGDAEVTVDYSGVELKHFKRFMQDSDPVYISAQGHWGDGTTARKQWYLFYKYLLDERAIIQESQAGNRTWRWRSPTEYRRMMAYVTMTIPRDMIPEETQAPDGTEALPEIPARAKIEYQFSTGERLISKDRGQTWTHPKNEQ
jgi:hypothetical protein